MKNSRNFDTHDFYCIQCGKKGIPIARANNKRKGKEHRKYMYCPNCKHMTNHIECWNELEAQKFQNDFQKGVYIDESREELEFERTHPRLSDLCDGRDSGIW